jgi:hypothetical protein
MQLTARNNIELSSYEPVSFASQKPFATSARNSLCFAKIRCHANLERPASPLQSSRPNCSISLSPGRKSSLSSLASSAAEIEYFLQNSWQEIGQGSRTCFGGDDGAVPETTGGGGGGLSGTIADCAGMNAS